MNQDQRELLELAAYAIGLDVVWRELSRSRIAEFGLLKHTKHCGFYANGKEFNPIRDYGDALHLSASLCIDVLHRFVGGQRVEALAPGGPVITEYCDQETRGAATMLAITRAAAAIGKQMKEQMK